MGLRLKKTQLEAKPETSKTNVVKKFGAKFRKAFSRKKQSLTLPLEEAFVQEPQPAITTHSSFLPLEEGRLLTESNQGVIQGHTGVEEGPRTSNPDLADSRHGANEYVPNVRDVGLGINSQISAVTTTPEPAGSLNESVIPESQQETQRQDHAEAGPLTPPSSTGSSNSEASAPRHPRKARRSSCPPPRTSSPDSNHSSETLFSTPRHSKASSSPIYTDFRRTVDKHGSQHDHCWSVLAEHLKTEEEDVENTTWKVVVEYLKFAHQTEVVELKSQVFSAETILAARDVDLANEKDGHDAALETIETLREERSDAQKRLSERSTDLRNAKKEIRNLKKSLVEIFEQCSLDESTPEDPGLSTSQAAATGEERVSAVNGNDEESAARVEVLEKQNEILEENLEYATDEVARLRSEAKTTQEEVKELRAQNSFARVEVGHLHTYNAYYRAEMEDKNPARTAHIDGYLKRKDEAYAKLEMRAAECAEELAKEKKDRAIDGVYAEGQIRGLTKELAHRSNTIVTLTEARDELKQQKEGIFQMFQDRIFPSDVDGAFRHDYDVVREDNTFLIKIVKEHQAYHEDAEKPMADLQAEKLTLEHAAHSDQLKLRQMQQSINGLEAAKGALEDRVKVLEEVHEEAQEGFMRQIQQQAEEIERLLWEGADDGWTRRFQEQAREIASCRGEMTRLESVASQWQMRALEVQDDFCPMLNCPEVMDWNAEESRWRLSYAERRAAELEKKVAGNEEEG